MAETLGLAAGWTVLASGPCITALGSGRLGARGGEGVQVGGAAGVTHRSQVAEGRHTGHRAAAPIFFSRILDQSLPAGVLYEDQLYLMFCDLLRHLLFVAKKTPKDEWLGDGSILNIPTNNRPLARACPPLSSYFQENNEKLIEDPAVCNCLSCNFVIEERKYLILFQDELFYFSTKLKVLDNPQDIPVFLKPFIKKELSDMKYDLRGDNAKEGFREEKLPVPHDSQKDNAIDRPTRGWPLAYLVMVELADNPKAILLF
ncbi:hypothetical protein Celaphus_00019236, partial [Cervus elaphus hippelaphus]